MLGAIHFGVLAACFVLLFVPTAMAGWHLSRNKMLFFSCASFISLAVCVNLTPYFPSVSDIVASVSSIVVYHHRNEAGFVALSLLNLVSGSDSMDSVKGHLFKRHSDYKIVVMEIGMKLDFVWAPYKKDLDDLVVSYKKKSKYPDVLMMGSGLWQCFMSTMLLMSDTMWHEYDRSLRLGESKILRQMGGPLILLDIQSFRWNCRPQCTLDGMHYGVAVHVMLNALPEAGFLLPLLFCLWGFLVEFSEKLNVHRNIYNTR